MENEVRKHGYITLERIFSKDECTLINFEYLPNHINLFSISNIQEIFSYQGDIWLFKPEVIENTSYLELIVEELAHDFGIPCAHYDLATLNHQKGTITKYFKKKDCTYFFGEDLLKEYVEESLKITDVDASLWENALLNHNSLEGIWRSLDYHYRNLENREEVVQYLMNRLVDIFIFDLLTHQKDRHSYNWGIEEANGKIDLQLLYDNEFVFDEIKDLPPLVCEDLEGEDFSFPVSTYSTSEALLEFLEVSDSKYLEKIKNRLSLIQKDNIMSVISRVEKRIGCKIPKNLKSYIENCFKKIVMETTESIQKYTENLRIK